eukprot:scaffold176391_cov31-Tisochrysis_lutea.AAC.1
MGERNAPTHACHANATTCGLVLVRVRVYSDLGVIDLHGHPKPKGRQAAASRGQMGQQTHETTNQPNTTTMHQRPYT